MTQFHTRVRTRGLWTSAAALLLACGGDEEGLEMSERQQDVTPKREVRVVENLKNALPSARLAMRNGRVNRIYGTILGSGDTPEQAANSFKDVVIAAHGGQGSDMRPVASGSTKLAFLARPEPIGLMYDDATDSYGFWLYRYAQQVGGIPVYDSDLLILVKNEPGHPVVWANSSVRNIARFTPALPRSALTIDAAKSLAAARAASGEDAHGANAPNDLDRFEGPRQIIFAGAEDRDEPPRLAMLYDAEDSTTQGKWRFVADARNGDVLHVVSLVQAADVSGSVRGNATNSHGAWECGPETSLPMNYAEVNIAGGSAGFTSDIGFFFLPNAGNTPVNVVSTLQGNFFDVNNLQGPNAQLTLNVTPPNQAHFLHNPANNQQFVIAQANAYYHVNRARDFLIDYAPGYPIISTQTDFLVEVNGDAVNRPGSCPGNAWYFGSSVLFCVNDGGVTNTAFGTVAYHEFGHHIVSSGGSGQGEYGEGMADTVAALLSEHSRLAVGWNTGNCDSYLRDADNTCQYDAAFCSSCGSEAHACGQLISGIVWDLRQELMLTEPQNFRDIVNSLTLSSVPLHTGTAIDASVAIDFLTLDDNDGNLANGTPHGDEICTAFDAHGIDCPLVPQNPCDSICSNPVTFSWAGSYQSGPLGTGAICRETMQPVAGGNCGNFAGGRTLSVNGTVMPCNNQNWPFLPPARNGGYCVTTTTGNHPWAFFTMW